MIRTVPFPTMRFSHPTQPEMFVEVVLASRHPGTGKMVVSLHMRYPRIIHGELMTHRVFCRNARSSRAVPVKTLLNELRTSCFVPWHWTRNQRGMQGVTGWQEKILLKGAAAPKIEDAVPVTNEMAWLWGRDMMCDLAESFMEAEYHKQVANRLVEPFMWMDMLVTATHWANFLHLRDHPDAEPHIRDLAVLVGQALLWAEDHAELLAYGEWHLPYIKPEDWVLAEKHLLNGRIIRSMPSTSAKAEVLKMISSARCARISYTPFDGDGNFDRELERFNDLTGNDAVHASPLEHQCTPDMRFMSDLTLFDELGDVHSETTGAEVYEHPDLHGPLTGFIQFRKTVPNEAIHD